MKDENISMIKNMHRNELNENELFLRNLMNHTL